MKRVYAIPVIVLFLFLCQCTVAQFKPVADFSINSTPVNGVKIKTSLPFPNDAYMPTIMLEGFAYGRGQTIGLMINYYIFQGAFWKDATSISSFGGYTPRVLLGVENGKVVIFIDDKCYFERFSVKVLSIGHNEPASYFTGWSAVDEPLTGSNQLVLSYKNNFAGTVGVNGTLAVNGTVGIGVEDTKGYKLAVGGKMIAERIVVKNQDKWPDFVFDNEYKLPVLDSVALYIRQYKHLPGVSAAKEVGESGLDIGLVQAQQLQKIEELTLYILEQHKKIGNLTQHTTMQEQRMAAQEQQLRALEERLKKLEK